MSEKPYYFRTEAYLYHIQSHPNYYFCVGASKDAQALWGVIGETVYLVWFSPKGDIQEIEAHPWSEFITSIDTRSYDSLLAAASLKFTDQYGLKTVPISVKRFWIQNIDAGIEDASDTIKEAIQFPERFNTEELFDSAESLEVWKSDGQYVIWWEQNYYMSREGAVVAS